MKVKVLNKLAPIAGSVLAAVTMSSSLKAQDIELDLRAGNEAAATGKGGGFALEEVVVTARKSEESLQESPISVSAFSGDAMKSMGLTNLKDFDGVVPGLNMGGGGNGVKADGNPYIRGVGQRETKVTVDTAVGTYIDGVYIGRAAGALMDAVDVQSIQVLRGPQGTLFGKNTTGGAMVITTKKPDDYLGGKLNATVGTYGRRNASGTVNLPLIDGVLNSRFTIASTKSDGWMTNVVDGKKWNDDDRLMGIAQLRWNASDDLTADFMWSATKTRQQPRGMNCRSFVDLYERLGGKKPTLEILLGGFGSGPDETVQGQCDKQYGELEFATDFADNTIFGNGVYEVNTQTVSATVDYYLTEVMQLKSITAWRQTGQRADEDIDGIPLAFIQRKMQDFNETNQYSQELQLSGDFLDGRLRYVLGLYGFWEQTDNDAIQDLAGFYVPKTASPGGTYSAFIGQSFLTVRETNNEAYSFFSQFSYDISDYIELTLGLRYTTETRETAYKEARVQPGSIFQSDKITNGDVSGCQDLKAAQSGGCTVVTNSTSFPVRPFSEWKYGFDVDKSGVLENDELGLFGTDKGERTDKGWTPMLSVKYMAHDSVLDALRLDSAMMFFTYSEGFRSGGVTVANGDYNADGIKDLETFDPEFVDNFEIGLKLEAFDQRLRGNFAVFFTDYQDIQVTTVIPEAEFNIPLPAIENAGQAEIKGFEGELTYLPTEELRIMFNFAYTDGQYKKYTVDSTVLGFEVDGLSRADEPMPRVADWTAFLSLDYTFFSEKWGTIIPSVAFKYMDEFYHGFDRDSFVVTKFGGKLNSEAETFIDARLTWMLPDERTTLTFWGKNLEDKRNYLTGGIPLVSVGRSSGVIYGEPRMLGLDLTYKFGDEY